MGNILVVDDEKGQRDILKKILANQGYDVLTGANAADGLRLFKENEIDVVLTDLKMPGMDGIAFLKDIIKERAHASVVIMTAHGTIGSAVEAMKLGAFDYLTKPFDMDEMLILNSAKHLIGGFPNINDRFWLVWPLLEGLSTPRSTEPVRTDIHPRS